MAADKNLVYTITINDNATAVIRNVNGQILKTGVSVDNLDKELLQLNGTLAMSNNQFAKQKNALIQAQNQVAIGSERYNQLSQSITNLNNRQQALIGSSKSGLTGVSVATGSASAAVLEMGRVISDSNYGIRGVANNLSQLASNMVYTSKAAGGFALGLKQIWKAMLGPLGILLAFQAGIALLEKWSMRTKTAEKSTEDFTKKIKEQNDALEENLRLLRLKIGQLTDFINKDLALTLKGAFQGGIADTNQYEAALTELYDRLSKIGAKDIKYLTDQNILQSDRVNIAINLLAIEEEKADLAEERIKQDEILRKNKEIQAKFDKGEITNAEYQIALRDREFTDVQKILDIQKEIARLKEANLIIAKKTVEIESDKKGSGSGEKAKDKDVKFSGQDDLPNNKWVEAYKKWKIWYLENKRRIDAELDIAYMETSAMDILNENSALGQEKVILDAKLEEDLRRIDDEIEGRKRLFREYADLEKEKVLIREQYAQAEKEIDQEVLDNKIETMGMIGNALGSFSDLAGKNTAIGKALAVASATIDTYAAANAALNDKTVPSTIARVALMTGIIAKGLLNVKQILAVKVPNQSSGGSAPAEQGRTFDFNLVGSTGQNQLAQTIGGQVGQTIRAYVVGSEITNQQQFDNQIQGNATIGGD